MVRFAIKKFGNIQEDELKTILETLDECYNCLKPHALRLVDLYIFESSSSMVAFLTWEKEQLGVWISGVGERFFSLSTTLGGEDPVSP